MSPINQRPGFSYRRRSRPSAPSFNRRANSARRDIRMDNKRHRSNTPDWSPIIIIAGIVVVAVIIVVIIAGNSNNNPSPNYSPSSTELENNSATIYQPPSVSTPATEDPTDETQSGGMIYTDDRVPHYSASNPVWKTVQFEWVRQDGRGSMNIEISFDEEMYRHYRSLSRYYSVDEYQYYINDTNNRAIIQEIVKVIQDIAKSNSYTDAAVVRELAKFVQDVIEYQYDWESTGAAEYPRYPIETLFEGRGDCEDTSILMAALLKELGYDVGFFELPGHLAVALRTSDDYAGGSYYEINGHRYLYIESTGSGWNIGEIPEDVQGQQATFHAIS